MSISSLNEECDPFDVVNGNAVAPCGAIANSLFNGLIIIISSRGLNVLIDLTGSITRLPKDPFFSTRDLKSEKFTRSRILKNWGLVALENLFLLR